MNKMKLWENSAYIGLALCIFANIAVGWFYLLAQFVYLAVNLLNVIRCFVLGRPAADKVRDIAFLGITVGLIVIRMLG